jgi:hypothetical protein
MKICIAGCGSVGSNLAYALTLKQQVYTTITDLLLIDFDVLESKNFPYLFITESNISDPNYKGCTYKVEYLHKMLSPLSNGLNIEYVVDSFENVININIEEYIKIDCRDSLDQSEIFKYKLTFDHTYARFIINPKTVPHGDRSNYMFTIKNNFNCLFFCMKLIDEFILDEDTMSSKNEQLKLYRLTPRGISDELRII